eukprot:scaffold120485_cov35-Tisochrysis_lutea.AAC.2
MKNKSRSPRAMGLKYLTLIHSPSRWTGGTKFLAVAFTLLSGIVRLFRVASIPTSIAPLLLHLKHSLTQLGHLGLELGHDDKLALKSLSHAPRRGCIIFSLVPRSWSALLARVSPTPLLGLFA